MYRDEYKVSMHWILVVNIMLLPLTGSVEGLSLSSVSEPLRPISLPAGLAEVGPDGGFKCLLEEFLQRLHETIYVWFLVHSRYSSLSWIPLGPTLEACTHWQPWHPCLLIWQETVRFTAPLHGPKFDQYLRDVSWPLFVPRHWEAHPRSSESSQAFKISTELWADGKSFRKRYSLAFWSWKARPGA